MTAVEVRWPDGNVVGSIGAPAGVREATVPQLVDAAPKIVLGALATEVCTAALGELAADQTADLPLADHGPDPHRHFWPEYRAIEFLTDARERSAGWAIGSLLTSPAVTSGSPSRPWRGTRGTRGTARERTMSCR